MISTNKAVVPELTSEDLQKIKQCATKKSFEKDEVIFSEGDEADNMYFIESGKLSVVIQKFTVKETLRWRLVTVSVKWFFSMVRNVPPR